MAAAFEPKFVDLVRNFTSTSGTGSFVLGNAVAGFSNLATALAVGDRFYYSVASVSQPNETEVGRGTLLANGMVAREPANGVATNFGNGTKTISLVAAADWFNQVNAIAGGILFTQIASRRFLKNVDRFHTSGRSQVGQFGGQYVRDTDQSQYTTIGQALIAGGKLTAAQVTAILGRIRAQDADGVYWTLAERSMEVGHFGAAGDGVTDDTAAVQAAIDKAHHWHGGGTIRIGSGEWALSSIQVRANVNIETAGAATHIRRSLGSRRRNCRSMATRSRLPTRAAAGGVSCSPVRVCGQCRWPPAASLREAARKRVFATWR